MEEEPDSCGLSWVDGSPVAIKPRHAIHRREKFFGRRTGTPGGQITRFARFLLIPRCDTRGTGVVLSDAILYRVAASMKPRQAACSAVPNETVCRSSTERTALIPAALLRCEE